jgi:hypothetical protein
MSNKSHIVTAKPSLIDTSQYTKHLYPTVHLGQANEMLEIRLDFYFIFSYLQPKFIPEFIR